MTTIAKKLSFEELTIGMTDTISVVVTLQDIDRFSQLSGDVAPLHTDQAFARAQGFEGRLAHGFLLGAYISQFIGTRLPGVNGVLQQVDLAFRNPVVPPETLKIEGVIESISAAVRQVAIKVNVTNSQGKIVAIAKVKSIIREESKEGKLYD